MKGTDFELGERVVVKGWAYVTDRREVKIEGDVTARSKTAIRVKWKGLFRMKQKWFSTDHESYHVEKARMF